MEEYILSHIVNNGDDIKKIEDHFKSRIEQLKEYSKVHQIKIETRYKNPPVSRSIDIFVISNHQIPKEVELHIYNQMEQASAVLRQK